MQFLHPTTAMRKAVLTSNHSHEEGSSYFQPQLSVMQFLLPTTAVREAVLTSTFTKEVMCTDDCSHFPDEVNQAELPALYQVLWSASGC